MKLQAKILSGFLILAAMLACAGMLSIHELRSIGSSVNRLLNDNYRSVNAAKTMLEALEMQNSGVLLALSGKWQQGHASISAGDRMFQQAFETARNNLTVPGEGDSVGAIASAYAEHRRLWTQALEERGGGAPPRPVFRPVPRKVHGGTHDGGCAHEAERREPVPHRNRPVQPGKPPHHARDRGDCLLARLRAHFQQLHQLLRDPTNRLPHPGNPRQHPVGGASHPED
jgi:hypothetical protein